MKKIIGWILICIPSINLLGGLAGSQAQHSPIGIILFIMMFFGGVILVASGKKETGENDGTKKLENG